MATTVAEPVFVDTNNLIYARQAQSPFHALATTKLQALVAAGHSLWISRQVLREYLAAYPDSHWAEKGRRDRGSP